MLRRTPYGAPGDIVDIENEVFEAYDREVMVKYSREAKVEESSDKAMTDVKNTAVKPKSKK